MSDYNLGQEHCYYGFGKSRNDSDYLRGYRDMESQLESERFYDRERRNAEANEAMMIEEEMQHLHYQETKLKDCKP